MTNVLFTNDHAKLDSYKHQVVILELDNAELEKLVDLKDKELTAKSDEIMRLKYQLQSFKKSSTLRKTLSYNSNSSLSPNDAKNNLHFLPFIDRKGSTSTHTSTMSASAVNLTLPSPKDHKSKGKPSTHHKSKTTGTNASPSICLIRVSDDNSDINEEWNGCLAVPLDDDTELQTPIPTQSQPLPLSTDSDTDKESKKSEEFGFESDTISYCSDNTMLLQEMVMTDDRQLLFSPCSISKSQQIFSKRSNGKLSIDCDAVIMAPINMFSVHHSFEKLSMANDDDDADNNPSKSSAICKVKKNTSDPGSNVW
eukprot:CAMPEP_0202707174 /NCGR_PEP_ID=MMETSP1385-20130828/19516_1 /ASSEMBLY_ACC=CAM_ASM_000861 /TAXON_ID=933848 /ORGANISM="Elphidium margaritaceum" /LENGTH=309 /DNA_ID=CAMNT_0049365823 /DNA_START=38 /DNA_END=964 /DNA_ORIENTATION=+